MRPSSIIAALCVGLPASWASRYPEPNRPQAPLIAATRTHNKVPLTLGVMSQCPDAIACEAVIDKVLKRVGQDIVDLGLIFVARLDETSPRYGVDCKHGELECTGDVHELCVAQHRPDSRDWWRFVKCLNSKERDRIGTLPISKRCARAVGVDWVGDGVEACVDGEEGPRLLRESVVRTRELGVTKSCTVLINGKARCVYDGGEWKECKDGHSIRDFARAIEEEFQKLNPED